MRQYECYIRRNERWKRVPDIVASYRAAVRFATEQGVHEAAQAIRLCIDGRVAAEAERQETGRGDWRWIRGGWNWSE